MPYPKEFPHQLLGVGRAFVRTEQKDDLKEALGKANRKDPPRAAKHIAAYSALANTKKRLEYEILLPHGTVELERELEQLVARLGQASFLPQTCPALPAPGALTGLSDSDFEADFSEVDFPPPPIALSDDYDNLKQARLPIIFDK